MIDNAIDKAIDWIKRHPGRSWLIAVLAVAFISQMIHGRATPLEVYQSCIEASELGWADRRFCADIAN